MTDDGPWNLAAERKKSSVVLSAVRPARITIFSRGVASSVLGRAAFHS